MNAVTLPRAVELMPIAVLVLAFALDAVKVLYGLAHEDEVFALERGL